MTRYGWLLVIAASSVLAACPSPSSAPDAGPAADAQPATGASAAPTASGSITTRVSVDPDACKGPYPSYWQDPAFTATGMWAGQKLSNQPPPNWKGPVFKLSQKYPAELVDDSSAWGWMRFNPFKAGLSPEEKQVQAKGYIDSALDYIQAGNIASTDPAQDFSLCNNRVRNWYHMPYQTYDPLSGREFTHGLTREAPVTFTLSGSRSLKTTVWAVAFYNARAASALGKVWPASGTAVVPASNFSFPEGTVIGKLLFTTATKADLPFLENLPTWQANISATNFCACKPAAGKQCTFAEMSEQCPRAPAAVTLMQFDVAVRDKRAPLGWAYGTFVADGQQKASEKNAWKRISALGLMWGNDTPPAGQGAFKNPADPRKNGFAEEVVFWDVVDRLNQASNAGHLGCDSRLNGPADNVKSSCLSCHQTASVPDSNLTVPPIFIVSGPQQQCVDPPAAAVDAVYFANMGCATPFQGGSVVPAPKYASGATQWVSTDFSLQLSISLTQYQEWIAHSESEKAPEKADGSVTAAKTKKPPARRFRSILPAR